MLNLVGKNLSVSVPVSVLKKMGHIEGAEKVQDFFEKMFRETEPLATHPNVKKMEEYIPYLSNAAFAGIVINKMIVNNQKFSEALEEAQPDLQEEGFKMGFKFTMLSILPGASEMISAIIGELVKSLSGISVENPDNSNSNKFTCQISEVSEELWAKLEKLGVLSISDDISNMEKVAETFQSKMIVPLINALYKGVMENENVSEEELDDDERAELKELIDEAAEFASTGYIIQIILTNVLTKAIEDDITVAEAMATYEENELAALAVETIIFSEDLAKYAKELENVMKTISSIV